MKWFPFVSIRKHHNEVKQRDKVIHCHYIKIQSLELTIRNLQEELRLSKPKRDAKGRFTK